MSIMLLIASIALSACSATDLNTVCFTDLSAPLVYAYDTGSREALIIERFSDHTANTSYRIETTEHDGILLIEDSWMVTDDGVSGAVSTTRSTDFLVTQWPLRSH